MCNDDSVQFGPVPSEAAERLLASEVVHVSKIHPLEISHAMQIRLHVEFLELLGPNIALIVSRNGCHEVLGRPSPFCMPQLGEAFSCGFLVSHNHQTSSGFVSLGPGIQPSA